MKISKQLPQFNNKRTLFIVSGKAMAHIYEAHNGIITLLKELEVRLSAYSDREGHFKSRSKDGQIIRSGAVYEEDDNIVKQKLQKSINREINMYSAKRQVYDGLYLYAPRHFMKALKEGLPPKSRDLFIDSFIGNYTQAHPFVLLEKIKNKPRSNKS